MKHVLPLFLLILWSAFSPVDADDIEKGTEKNSLPPDAPAGDYTWHPDVSPMGPVVLIVDLSKQKLDIYRDGKQIGSSTISSGKKGYRTPPGIFTILQKNVDHHSSVYHEASMPFMERLTWDGVAIHAGNVPGYPESHGCVHIPMDFAKKLYEVTTNGTTVLVRDDDAPASPAKKPDLVFSDKKESTPLPAPPTGTSQFAWKPEASSTGPLCLVFSTADKQVYVYRDGIEIGRSNVGGDEAGNSLGNRIYTASDQTGPDGYNEWNLLGSLDSSPAPNLDDLRKKLNIPPAFLDDLRQTVIPGTTLVVTDQPVDQGSAKSSSGNILDTDNQ